MANVCVSFEVKGSVEMVNFLEKKIKILLIVKPSQKIEKEREYFPGLNRERIRRDKRTEVNGGWGLIRGGAEVKGGKTVKKK